jgi:hypothetical protein
LLFATTLVLVPDAFARSRAPGFSPMLARASPPAGSLAEAIASARSRVGLPASLEVGASTAHRYRDPRVIPSTIAVTLWVPLPSVEDPGEVRDLNAMRCDERLPERCVIGDGSLRRALIGIDKRPGSPLDRALDTIAGRMPRGADGRVAPEAAVEFVRRETNNLVRWTAGARFNDGRPELPWDRAIDAPPESAWSVFRRAGDLQVGERPLATGLRHPVVPLERWLEAGEGYCIQKALLGTLLLERAGVASRMVQGAVAQGPGTTTGHAWIELGDGRVLDPAWGRLEAPGARDPAFPDRFRFGGSFRFANQCYPYLALPSAATNAVRPRRRRRVAPTFRSLRRLAA